MDEKTVYSSDYEDLGEEKAQKKKLYKPFGITSMVFGILSLVSYVSTFSMPFAFLYPFVGLLFASYDLKRNKERTLFGKVGYITSTVALIIEIIIVALLLAAVVLISILLITSFDKIGTI